MHEQPKVFVIVCRRSSGKLGYLALKPCPEPGRNTKPYVVTGGVEAGESLYKAALREVEEEIGVRPVHIIDLNNTIKCQDHITGERYVEYCFGALITNEIERLNEEHVGYQWLEAERFTHTIWWDEDRAILQKMIRTIEVRYAQS